MPVTRYRDVSDMPGPHRAATALEGIAAACAASELAASIGVTRTAPRGVRRFRSVEDADADAHRSRWESGTPVD
jgi:hypothetical protein